MTAYLIAMYFVSLAFGYVLAFTQSTLTIGKSIGEVDGGTGYQDAITPPRFTTIAVAVYVAAIAGVIYGLWEFGWLTGLAVAVGFFVAAKLNMALLLPKIGSGHFRSLILRSMINRHADYLKSGDSLRATVMAELLAKLGMPMTEPVSQSKRANDA